jgi:hypothetical protein
MGELSKYMPANNALGVLINVGSLTDMGYSRIPEVCANPAATKLPV